MESNILICNASTRPAISAFKALEWKQKKEQYKALLLPVGSSRLAVAVAAASPY